MLTGNILAGHLITLLQSAISRSINPIQRTVLSITEISGGSGYNAIPDHAILKGTFRFLEDDTAMDVFKSIKNTIKGVSTIFGVDMSLEVIDRTQPLVTDQTMSDHIFEKAANRFGRAQISRIETPSMLNEDFSEFSSRVPSVFLRIGSRDHKNGYTQNLHSSLFDFNESILFTGTEMTVFTIISLLEKLSNEEDC